VVGRHGDDPAFKAKQPREMMQAQNRLSRQRKILPQADCSGGRKSMTPGRRGPRFTWILCAESITGCMNPTLLGG
jgi:hypothetical protein